MIRIILIRRKVVAAVIALVLVGCAGASDPGDESTLVVATTTIWGDVVSEVVGEEGRVEVLMPVGADPHEFQASAQQAAILLDADLVVANGLGLEEGLDDILATAEEDGANVAAIGPRLDPIPLRGRHAHEEENGVEEEHGGEDPHVWMDPIRMAEAARLIARELNALDGSPTWEMNGERYAARLEATHEEIVEILSEIPDERRRLVTGHDSLGYFAERYGLEVIGVVIPGGSTLATPSSAELAELVEAIRREGVNVIFADTTEAPDLAAAVAAEVRHDVEVVPLHAGSLGEEGSSADSLIGLLLEDASRIAEALAP